MNRTFDNQYKASVANVQASKQEGELYNVEIQVNEECVIYSNGVILEEDLPRVFENYFEGWQYDE